MKLSSLPTSKLAVLFGGVTGFWLVVGSVAAIRGGAAWRAVTAELERQSRRLAEERQVVGELPDLQRRYLEAREELGALEPVAADRLFVPGLVGDLASLAGDHGLELQSAEPEPRGEGHVPGTPGQVRLKVTVAGEYKGLLDFLAALQEGTKAVRIEGLEAKRDKDGPAGCIIAQLSLMADELPDLPELPELAQLPAAAAPDAILRPGGGAPREGPEAPSFGPQLPPGGVMTVPPTGGDGAGRRRGPGEEPGAGGNQPPNLGQSGGVERLEESPPRERPRRGPAGQARPPIGEDPGWDFSPPPGGWFGGQGGGQGGGQRPPGGAGGQPGGVRPPQGGGAPGRDRPNAQQGGDDWWQRRGGGQRPEQGSGRAQDGRRGARTSPDAEL